MMARTDDNRERDQEDLKKMMTKIRAETDTIQAGMKAIHERRMAKLDTHQERMMTHQESTETEPEPRIMQSIEEHQGVPKEDAAVTPVGELMKLRRV
jgi:Skp family chaperone for outer membrane proteins